MENTQIAQLFDHIADLLELQGGDQFRIRSYRNAARTISNLSERIADMLEEGKDLTELPNIGKSSVEKIREIVETGSCKKLQTLQAQVPDELTELMQIPQLGARKVKLLHDKLGINSVDELKQACEDHRVRDIEGMGAKTEENILKGIQTVQTASGRTLLKEAAELVETIGTILTECPEVKKWQVAGSYRRRKETVGDLDFLVESTDRKRTADTILAGGLVSDIIGRGEEKISVILEGGVQVDFRFFEESAFGAALMYFTGSKAHNIALRQLAIQHNWKLNEYGLFEDDKLIEGETEERVYRQLNLPWIAPELREDEGEIEAAVDNRLPALVEDRDIRGDMHCHSVASDGKNTLTEMAQAAMARGYEYLGICDHSQAVRVANGLDENGLRRHMHKIREVDAGLENFRLMAGVEVDILKDGSLDLDPALLAQLDWVTASCHFHLNLDAGEMTERLLAVIKSGVVNCIGHPFGRYIGKRDPVKFDVDQVFAACSEHGVCLEINAQPERLDLPDIYCRKAKEAGVKMVISTDAHALDDLSFMHFGVGIARRGWLEKGDILNTDGIDQMPSAAHLHRR